MLSGSRREYLFGIIITVSGIVYMGMTMRIPRKGSIDATFIPTVLAAMLIGLGILQLATTYLKARASGAAPAAESVKKAKATDYRTVIITVALIVAYVLLLEYVGFLLLSAAYLFVQITLLTPRRREKRYLLNAVIALATSGLVFYVFRMLLDLMLPLGLLRHVTNL